jgi:hypothetical protein
VPKDTFEQKERKECLPFEMTQAQLEEMHRYDPCAQYKVEFLSENLLSEIILSEKILSEENEKSENEPAAGR